jgi:hypothetical protein
LVLVSTVLGGWAVAAADHTVSYWATAGPVQLGKPVTRDDFVSVRAKVPKRTARGLLRTDRALPSRLDEMSWAAAARPGTLITRDLIASRRETVELPVVVASGNTPAGLQAGDRIDVWASTTGKGDEAASKGALSAQRVLSRVRVLSRSSSASVSGGSGQTVVVDVAGMSITGRIVAAVSAGRVTIVRVS